MLASIDLFSGMGGLTLALHEVCTPVVYCEIDESCQAVLRRCMAKGLLPVAPIRSDVKALEPPRAQVVMGGFPCQGISKCGNMEGLAHAGSSLVLHMIEIAEESQADLLFFENVSDIVTARNDIQHLYEAMVAALTARGFSLKGVVTNAKLAGCPTSRRRWFGMARRASSVLEEVPKVTFVPHALPEPAVRAAIPTASDMQRLKMLGNSVCPQQVQQAWNLLADAWNADADPVLPTTEHVKDYGLVLKHALKERFESDPYHVHRRHVGISRTLPDWTSDVALTHWRTPRASQWTPATRLSRRTRGDLSTAIRFEQGTRDEERAPMYKAAPRFVEWLMGYPAGWTD
jgi:site-specific DNA-cytosine methylase